MIRALAALWFIVVFSVATAATPPNKASDGAWLARAQQELAHKEYQSSVTAQGLQAPNRAQGFRTWFDEEGVRLVQRTAGATPLFQMQLSAWGRDGTLHKVAKGKVSHQASRVEIRRPGLVEWYENGSEGLEQGFTLKRKPHGQGDLRLRLNVQGAELESAGEAIHLKSGTQRLRYSKLQVRDASDTRYPATMKAEGQSIVLKIHDQGARYPLTIDPLITGVADAQLEANQEYAEMGFSVASAGDVNGDGYVDVVVGADGFDNGQVNEGAAFVYHGGPGAFDPTADAQLESDQNGANLGNSVAGAGDVNGDGYADLIVGSRYYNNGQTDEGVALVYFGGAGIFDPMPDAVLQSNQASAYLGNSVAGAGDVNGDGYADVIVGATRYDTSQTDEGAAFVYFGGAGAFNSNADAQLVSAQAGAYLGESVAGAGDLNGDGYDDVIVGAVLFDNDELDEGTAFVYFGGAGVFDPMADAQLESNQVEGYLGSSVAGAGDVNGDGYADVIVGASGYSNGQSVEGAAFVYFGAAGDFDITADAQLESNQPFAQLGVSVAGAGDVNADGYADVIVGASQYDNPQIAEGAAFVYYGSAGTFNTTSDAQLESNQTDAQLGVSVAGAGDVNDDGYADVIVGAPFYTSDQNVEGVAFVYFGGDSDLIFRNGFE